MASVQSYPPSDSSHQHNQLPISHQQPTQCQNNKNHTNHSNNEQHSFSEKMKEMANSARKMFNHHEPNAPGAHNGKPAPNHVHKHTSGATAHHQGGTGMEKKKKKLGIGNNKAEGGHCMPNMLEHMKKKKDKKKNRDGKNTFSDSSSSSESEDEKCHVKKN